MKIGTLEAIAWLLVTLLTTSVLFAQANDRGFGLRGTVVDFATGEPLPGVWVGLLTNDTEEQAAEPVTSGVNGEFAFQGLENKHYFIVAYVAGEMIYFSQFPRLGEKWDFRASRNGVDNIVFRVGRNPVVSGVVRDEFGDPAPHAYLQMMRAIWGNGETVFTPFRGEYTDDLGRYRISANAGSYALCASIDANSNLGGSGDVAPQPETADYLQRDQARSPMRSCTVKAGGIIALAPGDKREIDFVLRSAKMPAIRGRVVGAETGQGNVNVKGIDELGIPYQVRFVRFSSPEGSFQVSSVEPGLYSLLPEVAGGPAVQYRVETQGINVGTSDVNDIELKVEATATIDVSVQGTANSKGGEELETIGLRQAGVRGAVTIQATKQSDGRYKFSNIPAGSYWIVPRTKDPACTKSVVFHGQDALKGPIAVAAGTQGILNATMSMNCAAIEGQVSYRNEPARSANVDVLLSGSVESPGDVYTMNTDENGKFKLTGLAPGRYVLWSWRGDDPHYPQRLADVKERGLNVVLREGQTMSVALDAIVLAEGAK